VWLLFRPLEAPYREALLGGVEAYYKATGEDLRFRQQGSEIVFRTFVPPGFEANLSPRGIYANSLFLITLILATPGMRWQRRAWSLALAMAILYLTHLAFLLTKVEITLIAAKHPLAGSPAFWGTVDNFQEITGKVLWPVSIWLLVALPYMLGRVDRVHVRDRVKGVGRNAPCPCGSGRKYKHCCGRA
jgi:hypothetical protein